ncbi:hypothetical protein DSO57_1020622 [Entomophthora muscae]|uniref:Uncharacterized protein n=1 Tax=Entomophthora muscae TaxID=34485 RepID=A0ACC2S5S0_9FUNG|nr:hypothetical protein DSO57_1020622 [Entomophthora muscae]
MNPDIGINYNNIGLDVATGASDFPTRSSAYKRVSATDSSQSRTSIEIPYLADPHDSFSPETSSNLELPAQEESWYRFDSHSGVRTTGSKLRSLTLVFLVISFYWVASINLVFFNKRIFIDNVYPFPYPLFLTWFQLICALVILVLLGEISKLPYLIVKKSSPSIYF